MVSGCFMEIKVEKILERQPTIEGAGVRLNRVLDNDKNSTLDRFCFLTILAQKTPRITSKGFLGILTEGWKPLLTCGRAKLSTETAWATKA
jgi:hypothetical protein